MSSLSATTVYLVSGANRGIGLALVTHILEKHDNVFVYAGARDPSNSSDLKDLSIKHPGKMSIVKCVSADIQGNAALAKEIEERHGRVDTVIANAGIATSFSSITKTSLQELQDHFNVNVFGTIVLFQSVVDLLKKSSNARFIPVSSAGGQLDGPLIKTPSGYISYGSSKAALNWATRKIHFENDWLVAFPLNPGVVETDMLNYSITQDKTGLVDSLIKGGVAISVATTAAASVKIIDHSTREKEGGEFIDIDGSKISW